MPETIEKPLRASFHCRHYDYKRGEGPCCAQGVSLKAPGAANMCMPKGVGCKKREEYTDRERKVWKEWSDGSVTRMLNAFMAIPDGKDNWGKRGEIVCPSCNGSLLWSRARNNGHIAAACSTPNCTEFMQ